MKPDKEKQTKQTTQAGITVTKGKKLADIGEGIGAPRKLPFGEVTGVQPKKK